MEFGDDQRSKAEVETDMPMRVRDFFFTGVNLGSLLPRPLSHEESKREENKRRKERMKETTTLDSLRTKKRRERWGLVVAIVGGQAVTYGDGGGIR